MRIYSTEFSQDAYTYVCGCKHITACYAVNDQETVCFVWWSGEILSGEQFIMPYRSPLFLSKYVGTGRPTFPCILGGTDILKSIDVSGVISAIVGSTWGNIAYPISTVSE